MSPRNEVTGLTLDIELQFAFLACALATRPTITTTKPLRASKH